MSAERLRADVFRLRRRKFAWAVPLLLVLAVLLVAAPPFNLANLDTGGESIPQATAPGGPASRAGVFVPDPIATILLAVLSAFFLVGSVLLLLRNRSSAKRPPKAFSWWAVLARALGMTLLIALLVGWPKAIQAARERVGTQTNATAADTGAFTTVWPAASGWPVELFLIAAVLAALAWLVYLSGGPVARTRSGRPRSRFPSIARRPSSRSERRSATSRRAETSARRSSPASSGSALSSGPAGSRTRTPSRPTSSRGSRSIGCGCPGTRRASSRPSSKRHDTATTRSADGTGRARSRAAGRSRRRWS